MKLILPVSLLALLTLFLGCAQNPESKEKVDLKLVYEEGDEWTIVFVMETKGNKLISVREESETTFKVNSFDEQNGYTLGVDVLRLKYESKMGNEVEVYDSQKKEADFTADERMMHDELKDILDNNFLISVGEKGKVTKSFSYEDGRAMAEDITDMNNIQLIFPEDSVSVGSSWEQTYTNPLTSQEIVSTYTVTDITNDKIFISILSKIPAIGTLIEANEAKGEYELDRATCRLIRVQKSMKIAQGGTATYRYYVK